MGEVDGTKIGALGRAWWSQGGTRKSYFWEEIKEVKEDMGRALGSKAEEGKPWESEGGVWGRGQQLGHEVACMQPGALGERLQPWGLYACMQPWSLYVALRSVCSLGRVCSPGA